MSVSCACCLFLVSFPRSLSPSLPRLQVHLDRLARPLVPTFGLMLLGTRGDDIKGVGGLGKEGGREGGEGGREG